VDPDTLYYLVDDDGTGHGTIHKVTLGASGAWTDDVSFTAPAPLKDLGCTLNWLDASGQYLVVRYGPEPSAHLCDRSNLATPYSNPIDGSQSIDLGGYVGITPDGRYLVGWDETAHTGLSNSGQGESWLIDHTNRVVAAAPTRFWSLCGDHGSFLSASDGRDYMVTYDCYSNPGLWRVDVTNDANGLNEAQQQALPNNQLLLTLGWNDFGHVSTSAQTDWAFIATGDTTDQFNTGTDDGGGSITPWHPYRQEIIAVNATTGEIRRLAQHRSRQIVGCGDDTHPPDYYSFPRLSVSWDGSIEGFASNSNQIGSGGSPVIDIYAIPFGSSGGSGPTNVNWINPVNVTVTGNTLQKTSGCDGCADAGAISSQQIHSGTGSLTFTAPATAPLLFAALTHAYSVSDTSSLDFAPRLQLGDAEVRENGVYKYDVTFASGDSFTIALQSGTVTYSHNGTPFYSHAVSASSPLFAGAILFNLNATIASAVISGGS